VYARKAAVLYFAGSCAALAGLGAWALLAAPDSRLGWRALDAGCSLLFLYAAAWIVLRYRGPILLLSESGMTYYSRHGLLLRAERRFVPWDAIARISFRAIPRGGRRMIIAERPEAHGSRPPPDLRINLGFLGISVSALTHRMNEFAAAKGVILH
jgi:hypothetical protein